MRAGLQAICMHGVSVLTFDYWRNSTLERGADLTPRRADTRFDASMACMVLGRITQRYRQNKQSAIMVKSSQIDVAILSLHISNIGGLDQESAPAPPKEESSTTKEQALAF